MMEENKHYFKVYDSFSSVLGLKGSELLLFGYIYNLMCHTCGQCKIANRVFRRNLHLSNRTIERALKVLDEHNYVVITYSPGRPSIFDFGKVLPTSEGQPRVVENPEEKEKLLKAWVASKSRTSAVNFAVEESQNGATVASKSRHNISSSNKSSKSCPSMVAAEPHSFSSADDRI